MIAIDIKALRKRLLPETGWRPWEKPRPAVEIDKWVSKQGLKRGDMPAHFDQDSCPYWYVRRGLITAVQEAERQAAIWTEKSDSYLAPDRMAMVPATKPEAIVATLSRYEAEASGTKDAIISLMELISRLWQTHIGVNGRLYEFDHRKPKRDLRKPEIDFSEALTALRPLVPQLESISKLAMTARKPWVNNQADVWKHTFVAHLGLLFSDLKKKPPKNSGPFKDFINDAWATLDCGHDEGFDRTVVSVAGQFKPRQKPKP